MANCNDECRPTCGQINDSTVPSALTQTASVIGFIASILGIFGKLISIKDLPFPIIIFILSLSAILVGLAIIAWVGIAWYDQCTEEPVVVTSDGSLMKMKGTKECVTGVVNSIKSDFSSIWSIAWIFPWTANHDSIDVVVRMRYWDVVESNGADVFCTYEESDRRSEILRCYFFTQRVCDVAKGALIGAVIAFVVILAIAALVISAVVLGVLAAAGCFASWGTGCSAAIIVALLVFIAIVGAVTLAGATIGGLVVVGTSQPSSPTAQNVSGESETAISEGDLINLHGRMLIKEDSDELFHNLKVNVFWWVSQEQEKLPKLLGKISGTSPFSHCEIDELFFQHFQRRNEETGEISVVTVSIDPCTDSINIKPIRCP